MARRSSGSDPLGMKVLMLTDEMLPGGVARHVVHLSGGLVSKGIEVRVAATRGLFSDLLNPKVRFFPLRLLKETSYSKSIPGLFASGAVLVAALKKERPDIIHTHKRYSDLIGRLLAGQYGSRHVSTCHNTFSSGYMLSKFGEQTIAVSDSIRRMLVEDFRRPENTVTTIFNECEPLGIYGRTKMAEARQRLKIPSGRRVIVSVGQFIRAKDRTTLLKSLGILKRRGDLESVLCLLIGHGDELGFLEDLARREGLEEHVRFLPGPTDVEMVMNLAEFCVLSSVQDGGIPYVLLEAASLAKPHVATAVGGIPEFVRDGETGLLVPPRDPDRLADAIRFLLNHPGEVRKLGRGAHARFHKYHRVNGFLDRTIAVYERALAGNKGPGR